VGGVYVFRRFAEVRGRLSPSKSYCCGCDSGQQQLDLLGLRLPRWSRSKRRNSNFPPRRLSTTPQHQKKHYTILNGI